MNKKSSSIIQTASVPILGYMIFFALPSNFFTSEHKYTTIIKEDTTPIHRDHNNSANLGC